MDSKILTRNTRLIAEALTRVIYNLTEKVSPPAAVPAHPTPAGWPAQLGLSPLSTGDPTRHAGVHGTDGNGGQAGRAAGGGPGGRWGL